MWRMFLQTVPKNAEKAVHKFSSQAVAQRRSLKKVFLEISAIEEGNRKHKSQKTERRGKREQDLVE